jgi:D-arabinose 1-dehydrogenase-like Zn-dependent alcohol dehydrogenase
LRERPLPLAGAGEIMMSVTACGVCRTDLHVAGANEALSDLRDARTQGATVIVP